MKLNFYIFFAFEFFVFELPVFLMMIFFWVIKFHFLFSLLIVLFVHRNFKFLFCQNINIFMFSAHLVLSHLVVLWDLKNIYLHYLLVFFHFLKYLNVRTSLTVQWLRLCASNAGGTGSISGQGNKTTCCVAKRMKNKLKNKNIGILM